MHACYPCVKGVGEFREWQSAFEADLLSAAPLAVDAGGPHTLWDIIECQHAQIRHFDQANRLCRAELEAEVKAATSAMKAYVRLRRSQEGLPLRSSDPMEARDASSSNTTSNSAGVAVPSNTGATAGNIDASNAGATAGSTVAGNAGASMVVDDSDSSSDAPNEWHSWWGKKDYKRCKVCGEDTYVYRSSPLRTAHFKRCQNAQCHSHRHGRRRR